MYLENIVVDAHDPQRLGRFWEALLGTTTLTDEPDNYETRLVVPDGPTLDLCFELVPEPPQPSPRLHLEVYGGAADDQARVVERALALGARHLDIGQRDVPWVVLADPEGNPFCVMEDRPEYAVSGPLSSLPLDSADVDRDLTFWSELSGWVPTDSAMPGALRHPSGRGPLLELCPEPRPKTGRREEPRPPRPAPRGRRRRGRGRGADPRPRRLRVRPRLGRPPVAAVQGPVRQRGLPAACPGHASARQGVTRSRPEFDELRDAVVDCPGGVGVRTQVGDHGGIRVVS